jgi:hypothetical protein
MTVVRAGVWRVWLVDGGGADDAAAWVARVERLADAEPLHRSKHAATHRIACGSEDAYVKLYHRYRGATAWKDRWRASKAANVVRMSARLSAAGFHVPRVLAAGEERRRGRLVRAWVATAALAGEPIAVALATSVAADTRRLARKRAVLVALGSEVARLHEAGVVAGDLVPANVWLDDVRGVPAVAFLDHDRTRIGARAVRWWRARRNLVQLNRIPILGLTVTDRLRVYRAYAAGRRWTRGAARRRLGWIIRKTIARRHRFDRVPRADSPIPFRELMRAGGPYAPSEP